MSEKKIILKAFKEQDINSAYALFKEALYDVSVEAFGWEENFQHDRFMKAYETSWFHWIEYDFKNVGYICFKADDKEIHIHLLIIATQFQSGGYGKLAMDIVETIAKKNQINITLSTLKNNTGAIKFYKKLGYEISHEDEYFYDLILKNN